MLKLNIFPHSTQSFNPGFEWIFQGIFKKNNNDFNIFSSTTMYIFQLMQHPISPVYETFLKQMFWTNDWCYSREYSPER